MSYSVAGYSLRTMLETVGSEVNAKLIMVWDTGHSKGFGFVEMENNADGHKAIEGLNEKDNDGRALRVNVAKPREQGNKGRRNRY